MGAWKDPDAIFSLCSVAVVERPGSEPGGGRPALRVEGVGLPISSSDIRKRAAEGRSIRYLVPEAVADYIAKRRLYR
jgi:nicotinate-nucleotide adenylyltransferase